MCPTSELVDIERAAKSAQSTSAQQLATRNTETSQKRTERDLPVRNKQTNRFCVATSCLLRTHIDVHQFAKQTHQKCLN